MVLRTFIYIFFTINLISSNPTPKGLICKLCESAQSNLVNLTKSKKQGLVDFAVKVCQIGLSPEVCKYFVSSFANDLFIKKPEYILETNYICSFVFNYCDKTSEPYSLEKFKADFYAKYPKSVNRPKNSGPAFNILVLNDIHIQSDYAYKANSDCGEPGGCCSNYHKPARRKEHEASYWGTPNKNCDIPSWFYDNTIGYIKEKIEKIDFIIVLGDNYGHNYFRTTEQDLLEVNKYVYDSLKGNFTDSVILPVLGNHECHPVDHLDFNDPDNFVYKHIYPLFDDFIGKDQIENLKKFGYYALSYPQYNVKVIHLNTQLLDMFNTDLMVDNTNPLGFFDIIGDEFYESELKGEKIIILTHIPIGDITSIKEFNSNLKIIIERFSDSIIGVFSGHTHTDSVIFLKSENDNITGVNYISPSLTTFSSGNPSFRVYHLEDQTIKDYTQYIFDIDKYNNLADNGDYSFSYQVNYRFRESYGLDNWGSLETYEELYDKLFNDDTYRHIYSYFYVPKMTPMKYHKVDPAILCTTYDNVNDIIDCQKRTVGIDFSLLIQQVFRFIFVEPWRSPLTNVV